MSSSERWVVVGGFGLAVASVVPWYKADEFSFGTDGARTNGWQEPDAVLSIIATIVGAGLAILVLAVGRGRDRPAAGSWSWGTLLTAVSAVVFGLVALKFSLNTDNTTVGVYLALTAAVTQLYGAYVTRVEEPAPVRAGSQLDGRPSPPSQLAASSAASSSTSSSPSTIGHSGVATALWPETAYFLATWVRAGVDLSTSTAAYRRAFASDPARLARLTNEVRSLLDPGRSEAERTELVRRYAPHLPADGASATLGLLLQALTGPPPP